VSESDALGHVKVAVAAAGIAFDFGVSNVGKTCVTSLETNVCYFPKGYCWAPDSETVPEPRVNEAVVFEDFFTVGLCFPLIRCLWIFYISSRFSCTIKHQMRSCKLANLFGQSVPAESARPWMSSHDTMSCTINKRRSSSKAAGIP
jgi:hypothetical protein